MSTDSMRTARTAGSPASIARRPGEATSASGRLRLAAVAVLTAIALAAPASAEAATRQWWGWKFNWHETHAIAYHDYGSAQRVAGRLGIPGHVVRVMFLHWREGARFSLWQRRCFGVTWVGSGVPGVRC